MRRFAVLLLAALLAALAPTGPGAATPPVTQDACPGTSHGTPELFLQWDAQLENLAFGHGALWATDIGADRLLEVNTHGQARTVIDTLAVHGLTFHPDGTLYLGAADPASSGGAGDWQVWRIDDLETGQHTVHASGFVAANGMAFDTDGNLFVSNPLGTTGPYLARVPAENPTAWTGWTDTYGPNGLWLDADGSLIAAITADQSSPIVRIGTDTPTTTRVATLTFGAATLEPGAHAPEGLGQPVVPKGLDDLTIGPDGFIYTAAHVTGEILRVDPNDGSACIFASGFEEPTSLRFANDFGAFSGDLFVTDMGGIGVTALATPANGAIWRIPLV